MSTLRRTINIDDLHVFLECDANAGILRWRPRRPEHFEHALRGSAVALCEAWNRMFAGERTFLHSTASGYHAGQLLGKRFHAHRVIYAMHFGEWPHVIDHINGDKQDNRISNLRTVSHAENMRNMPLRRDNKTGVPGVSFKENRWVARIKVAGKSTFLGGFDTFESAAAARIAAEKELGFHPNHGRFCETPKAAHGVRKMARILRGDA